VTPERWRQITELFHAALERDARDRAAFLAEACAGDDGVRREVESMLAQPASSGGFLDGPAFDGAPTLDGMEGPVLTGRPFGLYQMQARIGAGGMGEVYRARDTKLGRDVAIKVLPRAFTNDPERLARFEREARLLAALNHPHIGAIYGLEEADGVRGLVLELVPGETLAARLHRGPLLLAETLAIARQITDALDTAHERGIVHRDLKPANIKITPDGTVKVLDFGLAKFDVRGSDDGGLRPQSDLPWAPRTPSDGTEAGRILGTTAYMSPEQTRGQSVDKRTDIWAFGCVLYEMLTGRAAFGSGTTSDTIAAILQSEPEWSALPAAIPSTLRRLLQHCLEKDPRRRLRDIGDVRLELDHATVSQEEEAGPSPQRLSGVQWAVVAVLALVAVATGWLVRDRSAGPDDASGVRGRNAPIDNPLYGARFALFTDFPGAERDAAISPDGKFVVFRSDRDGPFDAFLGQAATGRVDNLTRGQEKDLGLPVRSQGFSGDGSEVWLSGGVDRRLRLLPLVGRVDPRHFLGVTAINVAWSPDGARYVYHTRDPGDPIFVVDRNGANPRQIVIDKPGVHHHYPVWSLDGKWIYFVKGIQATYAWDLWRVPADGGEPQRLTQHNGEVGYPAPIDLHTILYVARDGDRSGPWLWALDVDRKQARRVSFGLQKYTSLGASADGRRLVVSEANPTASLWSVPILDRIAEERDVTAFPLPTGRALMPRFGGSSLFYLSSRGEGDGLWRSQNGRSLEVWKGSEGALLEPPAVSADGHRALIVLRREGKLRLHVISGDGAEIRPVTDAIDVGGAASWSPDGNWIVTGGTDSRGDGLFKLPGGGGQPTRLVDGPAYNPVWSPDGNVILYSGLNVGPLAPLRAVRPDGTPFDLPAIQLRIEGERYRFLPDGDVVYMQGFLPSQDFWLLDLNTKKSRALTRLSGGAAMRTFDITPDGSRIVFDRLRENSDIVLIDLAR
jgi:serine/threonine protein kinase/Tol biopolymer transport system component